MHRTRLRFSLLSLWHLLVVLTISVVFATASSAQEGSKNEIKRGLRILPLIEFKPSPEANQSAQTRFWWGGATVPGWSSFDQQLFKQEVNWQIPASVSQLSSILKRPGLTASNAKALARTLGASQILYGVVEQQLLPAKPLGSRLFSVTADLQFVDLATNKTTQLRTVRLYLEETTKLDEVLQDLATTVSGQIPFVDRPQSVDTKDFAELGGDAQRLIVSKITNLQQLKSLEAILLKSPDIQDVQLVAATAEQVMLTLKIAPQTKNSDLVALLASLQKSEPKGVQFQLDQGSSEPPKITLSPR